MTYQHPQIKSPGLAAVLSFLWGGLGQIYNGEIGKGLLIMFVQFINALLMLVLIGFFTWPIVWIWGIYDAYKTAERINAEAAMQAQQRMGMNTKVCPQCAERVPIEAKVCRYCGYQFETAQQPAMLPTNTAQAAEAQTQAETTPAPPAKAQTKTCPACLAEIPADAKFCMHCGHRFDDEGVAAAGL